MPEERQGRLVAVPEDGDHLVAAAAAGRRRVPELERRHPRPHAMHGPRFLSLSRRLARLRRRRQRRSASPPASLGAIFGTQHRLVGLLALVALVGAGQALALEVDDGSISVSAVGALAGAALFGPRAALALAITTAVVEWSARRSPLHTCSSTSARSRSPRSRRPACSAAGLHRATRGRVVTSRPASSPARRTSPSTRACSALAVAIEGHERWWAVWRERFAWLATHYLVYGFIGGVIAVAYDAAGLYALAVFAVPLLLMRKTQEAYLRHTQRSAQKLRAAAETIQTQNVSLEHANRLLQGALDGGDGEPLGDGRRARRLHRRPLAARAAARAGDRPRARALAGRARPARPRGALPRHRQARDPGRDPAEAREPDRRTSGR